MVVSDGTPLIGNNALDAEAINLLYQKESLPNLASRIDGGHIELIVDEKKNTIYLVRDRIGLKPAYYSTSDTGFICSSNAGAIIKSGIIKANPNDQIISKYAVCNFRATYGSAETFFDNVNQVSPSTIISFSNNKLNREKYWDQE